MIEALVNLALFWLWCGALSAYVMTSRGWLDRFAPDTTDAGKLIIAYYFMSRGPFGLLTMGMYSFVYPVTGQTLHPIIQGSADHIATIWIYVTGTVREVIAYIEHCPRPISWVARPLGFIRDSIGWCHDRLLYKPMVA